MRRISVCCLMGLFIFLPVSFVFTQTRGEIEFVAPNGKIVTFGQGYALVIGEINYYNGWGQLKSIKDEVVVVKRLLEEQDFIVETLVDKTSDELVRGIENFLKNYGINENARLVVFFAGHGATYTLPTGIKKGYIVPIDAPFIDDNITGFLQKAIPITDLDNMSTNYGCRHILFIFDSCFSGSIFTTRGMDDIPPVILDSIAEPVRQFITAGGEEETVPSESILLPFMERALRNGEADKNGDGYVTGTELGMYLKNEIQNRYDNRWNPQYGKSQNVRLAKGDFVFFAGKHNMPKPPPPPPPGEKPALDSSAMREHFNGDWIGTDTRLQINGDRIIQYFKNEDGTWRPISPEKQYFLYGRNNLVYIWLNKGGVWSETQIFSLSNINSNALDFVWNRHVNNMANNEDNDVWNVNDHQILFRAGPASNIPGAPLSQSNNQTIPAQFHGSWIGEVNVKERDASIKIRLVVTANKVTQFFQDDDGSWDEIVPASSNFDFDRNNLVYVWVNKGGIWSETQAYSLSMVNDRTLNVVWSRHVNNYYRDEIVNQAWHVGGEGMIRK